MYWSQCAILGVVASIAMVHAAPTATATLPACEVTEQATPTPRAWDDGATNEFPIHASCNATETRQLKKALAETVELADHAKLHVLRWANTSAAYQKYFGNASTAEVIGWFDKVVRGDRGRTLFRCDNPDGNCDIPTWGGHWRGENATDETVICPLSYETRRDLEEMCASGYNVADWETNTYFASDLLHRLYHMPAIGEGHVEHFSETYAEALELARSNASYATHNSDSLQYFALEVYAYDVAVPGIGCAGPTADHSDHDNTTTTVSAITEPLSPADATTSSAASAPTSATEQITYALSASTTSSAPQECHTHADGTRH
ncbi:MAG: hypothetical protein M1816_003132, partial [Peltula sp. TS41687]